METSQGGTGIESLDKPLVARFIFREISGMVVLALTLFLPAGRIDWGMGWVLIAIMLYWATATLIIILRKSPALMEDRLGPKEGSKPWDMVILSVVGILTIARNVVAGLDVRYGWSIGFSSTLQIVMAVVGLLGNTLVVSATFANPFFSQTVRIQKERGHSVITDGPYRYIRHPGNAGTILFELSAPLILGSWWALIPGVINTILLILRTALEDSTLQRELEGYKAYCVKERSRLIPGLW
ncbi:MAG: isoprenylcysteine carboxylmethyltransferase family protein [Anaerolineales bacterium]|nr:isoprenylcysteine carboxylmethyltransferase family protein [Anaerolineales bacterium]